MPAAYAKPPLSSGLVGLFCQFAYTLKCLQLRSSVVGQVNEAEAEVEEARAQAEQERQERRQQMQSLLADKADLEAALHCQRQTCQQLQVFLDLAAQKP